MYDPEKIEELISNYHWKVREIARLKNKIPGMEDDFRKSRTIDRLKQLERDVKCIDEMEKNVTDDLDRTILNCLMDGYSYRKVGRHLRMATNKIIHRTNIMIESEISHRK